MSPSNLPRTVGELRAAGHRERGGQAGNPGKSADRALADGDNVWPGILGFDDTVIPQVRALIAGHDFVPLLGERGQGKTRPLRAPRVCWTSDAGDRRRRTGQHPTRRSRRSRSGGPRSSATTYRWRGSTAASAKRSWPPSTPASPTWLGDDPIKVAEGRSPRKPSPTGSSRGRTAASSRQRAARPRPNASRCRCLTPWRSATSRSAATRCGCRWMCWWSPAPTLRTTPTVRHHHAHQGPVRCRDPGTHYPLELRRRWASRGAPECTGARLPDAGARARPVTCENPARSISAPGVGVCHRSGRDRGGCRPAPGGAGDRPAARGRLGTVIDVLRGKLEFGVRREGREQAVLEHLLRRATADRPGCWAVSTLARYDRGRGRSAVRRASGSRPRMLAAPGLPVVQDRAQAGRRTGGERAAALELALEALHLAKRADKVCGGGPDRLWLSLASPRLRSSRRYSLRYWRTRA